MTPKQIGLQRFHHHQRHDQKRNVEEQTDEAGDGENDHVTGSPTDPTRGVFGAVTDRSRIDRVQSHADAAENERNGPAQDGHGESRSSSPGMSGMSRLLGR